MSYFEDYIQDGACCSGCGVFIGDDVGYMRTCDSCREPSDTAKRTRTQRNNARKRRAKARKRAEEERV